MDLIYKYRSGIVNGAFIIIFLLQGTIQLAGIALIFLIFLILLKLSKLKILPLYFYISIAVYLFFLGLGIYNRNPVILIDAKYQVFSFLFFVNLYIHNIDFKKLLFNINYIVFGIYILLYVGLFPNIWNESTFGFEGRVSGPPIFAPTLILFLYLLEGRSIDKRLVLAMAIGLFYILLTSNVMNLLVVVGLSFLLMFSSRGIIKGVLIACVLIVLLFQLKSFWPGGVALKLSYLSNPLEAPSVQIRLIELGQALNQYPKDIVSVCMGQGYGVVTEVYRINTEYKSDSQFYRFLEIDNGFYYLFHRGGLLLLTIFIITHSYLISICRKTKVKLGFLLIVFLTNVLSIHYHTYWYFLFLPYLILDKYDFKNNPFNYKLSLNLNG